jgi:hypothetical protein
MSRRTISNLVLVLGVLLATASAAVLAYGADAFWARYRHGLGLILFTHRLQWVLATVSLLLCVVVMALIIGGRRRAWWLITLGPVLALFVHRIVSNPMRQFAVVEDPGLAKAADAGPLLKDDDWVVGVRLGDAHYAYPFAALYHAPVIIQANHEQRFIVMWSAFANRATAFKVDHEIRKTELQIVAMPCNTLLLYNGRNGQFINAVTGETTKREKPIGIHVPIDTHKLTWGQWRTLHPDTLVMPPTESTPTGPILPRYPMPPTPGQSHAVETQVIFAPTTRPVVIAADAIGEQPAEVSVGETQLLMFRDKSTGILRAFDRRVDEDLFPMFRPKTDPKRPTVVMEDKDSGSEWTADGKAIEGPLKDKRLQVVPVEDGVYWGVIHYWYPEAQWVTPTRATGEGSFGNPKDPRRRRR